MGKRKSKAEIIDTGIYKRESDPRRLTPGNLRSAFGEALSAHANRHSPEKLNAILDECQRVALRIGKTPDGHPWNPAWGNERETRRDAMQLLVAIDGVRVKLRCNRPLDALPLMFDVGTLAERLDIRPHERDAWRGKKTIASAARGGQATRKLDEDQQDSAREERDRLIELGHSKQDASRLTGEKFGVSYRTIERL